MAPPPETEKRRSARIRFRPSDHLEVRYKFLSHIDEFQCDSIFKGMIVNLSKGGALFVGTIPGSDWLPPLAKGRVLIGLNVMAAESRIKALSSLRWSRPADPKQHGLEGEEGQALYELGVQFEQLDPQHKNLLSKFLIGHQLRTRRFRRGELMEG